MKRIQDLASGISFGKITILINEESPNVDITVEERLRLPNRDPRPGMIVRAAERKG
jgi:hypothetical protein